MAIMFASLCGSIPVTAKPRVGGVPPPSYAHRDISKQLPSRRYFQLMEAFRDQPRPSLDSDEEAFELVDTKCKSLFGKRIYEDIDDDIGHTESIASFYSANDKNSLSTLRLNISPVFEGFLNYRRTVFSSFKHMSSIFSSSQGFGEIGCSLLRPAMIFDIPPGMNFDASFEMSKHRRHWIGLIDRTYSPPAIIANHLTQGPTIYSLWSPLPGENGHALGLEQAGTTATKDVINDKFLASCQTLYGIFAPFYRWLLYGKKYRTMLEVENDGLIAALGLDAARFAIDPYYEFSEDISLPDQFFEFFGLDQGVCDICSKTVTRDNAFIVSARTVRQNERLGIHYRQLDEALFFQLFVRDWSDWLICLEDMARWNFPVPSRESDANSN